MLCESLHFQHDKERMRLGRARGDTPHYLWIHALHRTAHIIETRSVSQSDASPVDRFGFCLTFSYEGVESMANLEELLSKNGVGQAAFPSPSFSNDNNSSA